MTLIYSVSSSFVDSQVSSQTKTPASYMVQDTFRRLLGTAPFVIDPYDCVFSAFSGVFFVLLWTGELNEKISLIQVVMPFYHGREQEDASHFVWYDAALRLDHPAHKSPWPLCRFLLAMVLDEAPENSAEAVCINKLFFNTVVRCCFSFRFQTLTSHQLVERTCRECKNKVASMEESPVLHAFCDGGLLSVDFQDVLHASFGPSYVFHGYDCANPSCPAFGCRKTTAEAKVCGQHKP